jgi:hypothetical protein
MRLGQRPSAAAAALPGAEAVAVPEAVGAEADVPVVVDVPVAAAVATTIRVTRDSPVNRAGSGAFWFLIERLN